jgi:DNA-binding beta-propeller fold protein YncE
MTPPDRLDSWKEIAAYLKRDVRTVQRWEAFEGLPVHRHQHKKRGSVYALAAELDAWRESRRAEFFDASADEQPAAAAALTPAEPPVAVPVARTVVPVWAWTIGLLMAAAAISGVVLTRESGPPVLDPALFDAPRIFGEVLREGGTFDRIPVARDVDGLALSPDEAVLYVTVCRGGANGVQAIDVARRTTRWQVDGLAQCARPLASRDGRRVYALDGTHIAAIDAATGALRKIPTPAAVINALVLTPDDRTLYAAAVFKGLLTVDVASGRVETLSHLPCPMELALSRSGARLYVSYQCSGPGGRPGFDSIDVIDTGTNRSVAVISGMPRVGGELALTADGSYLWADGKDACHEAYYDRAGCSRRGPIVNIIRTSDHALVRSLQTGLGERPSLSVTMSPDGSRAILGSNTTHVVSTLNLREVESLPQPLTGRIVFTKDGRTAFSSLGSPDAVTMWSIPPRPAPPPGLTARWTMDGVVVDEVAENDFEALPSSAFAPGRIGLAVRGPAPTALRLSQPPNLSTSNGFMTAMAWIKPDAIAADMPIVEHATLDAQGPEGWRLFRTAEGRLAVCVGADSGTADCLRPGRILIESATVLSPGVWHHVAVSREGRKFTLFVNARAVGTGQADRGLPSIDYRWLRLGSSEYGPAMFRGLIDEVEIYNRTLTNAEIAERGR